MELDPIDPIAEAIVRLELRSETVGQAREFLNVLVAGHGTERGAPGGRPGSLAIDGGAEHHIAGEGVKRACRLRLVEHPMCAETIIGGSFENGWRNRLIHDLTPGMPQASAMMALNRCIAIQSLCCLSRGPISAGGWPRRSL